MSTPTRSRAHSWVLVVSGLLIQSAVIVSPLTPYPFARLWFDREAYEIERGYQHYLENGILKEGDPGFTVIREKYMEDVARGLLPGFDDEESVGLSLMGFQMGESEDEGIVREMRPVYIVYSNNKGHIVTGDVLKLVSTRHWEPHAATFNLALLILGYTMIYAGLSRGYGRLPSVRIERPATSAPGNALAPSARS